MKKSFKPVSRQNVYDEARDISYRRGKTPIMDNDKKNSLLIVDDVPLDLRLLARILRDEYNVIAASNGTTALSIAEQQLPDLILLDVVMPNMDGYQVLTALRANDRTRHIPVIFITGLNSGSAEKRCLELGAADYINKPFDDIIVRLRIRHQIQIVNQLRAIERLSVTDQLTGMYNRRHFDNQMRVEWGRAARDNEPLSLLIIDIDHFKDYNDKYGHQQGDVALCAVSQAITQTVRRVSDFAARWGGEEFVVLLPNTPSPGALEVGELIRENVMQADIPMDGGVSTKLTVSLGLHTCTPTAAIIADELIMKADKALYSVKNTSRNKVGVYEETL
jgi:diguanylate cyclase (GGDEF)-like protein